MQIRTIVIYKFILYGGKSNINIVTLTMYAEITVD